MRNHHKLCVGLKRSYLIVGDVYNNASSLSLRLGAEVILVLTDEVEQKVEVGLWSYLLVIVCFSSYYKSFIVGKYLILYGYA